MDTYSYTPHDAVVTDFKATLKECTATTVCGRHFVLVARLTRWMRSQRPSEGVSQTACLLRAAYSQRTSPGLPREVAQLPNGKRSALLVFAILLELGSGELIDSFLRNDLDNGLPIDLLQLRTKLVKFLPITKANDLAERFNQEQWRYCAATFNLGMGKDYGRKRIIPICAKEQINDKGGTADLWWIQVHEDFVGEELKKAVACSRMLPPAPASNLGYLYVFALKSFKEGNKHVYDNEKNAFIALCHNKGMVKYLGDYGHQEPRQCQPLPSVDGHTSEETLVNTYNILLEYGEYDLDEYFAQRLPPVFRTEIATFWKSLFEVADAVDGIHNLENEDGAVRKFHGWHADIKPDNILSVQGKFKLADPGFATFVAKSGVVPKNSVMGGTETFAAPERHTKHADPLAPVSQTIDVWSLGCVFSIAATWVVLGYQGVQQFEKLRRKGIIKTQQARQVPGQPKSVAADGDWFHDGKSVLDDVTKWHGVLRGFVRKTDTITNQVLDLIDQKMLIGSPGSRDEARDICNALKQISSQSEGEALDAIPESIISVLLEVDEKAPSKVIRTPSETAADKGPGQLLALPQDRKARKSSHLDFPMMKTAHRSEYLKSALNAQMGMAHISGMPQDSIAKNSELQPQHTISYESASPPAQEVHYPFRESYNQVNGYNLEESQMELPLRRNHHRQTSKTHVPQDVFRARGLMEDRQTGLLKKSQKDELLSKHFKNRDIKFLVDNAGTMIDYWYQATFLLETLVMKAAGQDEDGMDLVFTGGPRKLESKKKGSKFTNAMKKAQPVSSTRTDMKAALEDIFSGYMTDFQAKPHKRKDLTLIVLTDGIWDGMVNKYEVEDKVVHFIEQLRSKIAYLKDRSVSIEFIQFGDDKDATYRLRQLDEGLKWRGVPDIIDTEPATGDVNKMLLGSFVEEYDVDDEEENENPSTPTVRPEPEFKVSRVLSPEIPLHRSPPHGSPFPPPSRTSTQPTVARTLFQDHRRPNSSILIPK